MRTTVTLDADVERMLKDDAHARNRSFKVSLNEAVRDAFRLRRKAPARRKRFVVKARPLGLRPGIDPLRLSDIAQEMEDDAMIARMKKFEKAAKKP